MDRELWESYLLKAADVYPMITLSMMISAPIKSWDFIFDNSF